MSDRRELEPTSTNVWRESSSRGPHRGRGNGTWNHGPGPVRGSSTSGSSGWTHRSREAIEIMDKYANLRPDPGVEYPASWPMPTDEQFNELFTKHDILEMLESGLISKFTGKAIDYVRFKGSFFPIIHVQREPANIKAAALDSLIEPEVRERVFGIGLAYSEREYAERLERLERMYERKEILVEYNLNKIKSLKGQSRHDYRKFRELVDTVYFFIRGVGRQDAESLILREDLREGTPPGLLKRYFEETETRGCKDTLSNMLEWTHRNLKAHYKWKEFEERMKKIGKAD